MKKHGKALLWGLFALYLLCLALLLFQRRMQAEQSFNLIPLRTIRGYFLILGRDDAAAEVFRPYAVTNLLGNLLAFLPLGLSLPLLFRRQRRFWLFLLTAALCIAFVELLQLLSRRGALDVDDLLLNLPGAILGWLLWKLARRRENKKR
jgi:glycopeptide antibiotics resistance protein